MLQFWAWAANRARQRESLRSALEVVGGQPPPPGPILIIKVEEKLHKPGLLFLRDIWESGVINRNERSFVHPSFENPSLHLAPRSRTSRVSWLPVSFVEKFGVEKKRELAFQIPCALAIKSWLISPLRPSTSTLIFFCVPANLSNDRFTPAR